MTGGTKLHGKVAVITGGTEGIGLAAARLFVKEDDNSEPLHLKRGDVVVQNGTRHAWRNKGTRPVTMLFFLNGAKA